MFACAGFKLVGLKLTVPTKEKAEGHYEEHRGKPFFAGLANFNMKNLSDALRFNQECAAIKSPFQAKAAENAKVLRAQGVTTGASPAPKKKK